MKVNKIIIFKYDECDTFRLLTLFAFYSVIAFYSGRYFSNTCIRSCYLAEPTNFINCSWFLVFNTHEIIRLGDLWNCLVSVAHRKGYSHILRYFPIVFVLSIFC